MLFKNVAEAKKQTGLSYLGSVNISAKLTKNSKVFNQRTYSLYLSPADLSGYNTCKHSTPECRLGCLNTSGRAKIDILTNKNVISTARKKKTRLFFEHNRFFMQWLISDIKSHKKLAEKNGEGFSVRLNCTSDIDWKDVHIYGCNIFEIFSDVQFYDYTKNPKQFIGKSANHHLTFSYTGRNWFACQSILNRGGNVAVVFNATPNQPLPETFKGYKVIDGDISDYRVADKTGVIVGLRWKTIGNKENNERIKKSCFVVQLENVCCNNSTEVFV
jgi:hypothetical protein